MTPTHSLSFCSNVIKLTRKQKNEDRPKRKRDNEILKLDTDAERRAPKGADAEIEKAQENQNVQEKNSAVQMFGWFLQAVVRYWR